MSKLATLPLLSLMWLLSVVPLFAATSCKKEAPPPDDIEDLVTICNADPSPTSAILSDRRRASGAESALSLHVAQLKTLKGRALAAQLSKGDLRSKESALRAEIDRTHLTPCPLALTYGALVTRTTYARDLGALCESSWAEVTSQRLVDGASLESPEGKALLEKLAKSSAEDARASLGTALTSAGAIPYADDGKTQLDKDHCKLLTTNAPDGSTGLGDVGSPSASGTATLGKVTVHGSLSEAAANRTLLAVVPRFRLCYASARTSKPSLAGATLVTVKVDASGAVTDSAAAGGTLNDAGVSSCVARAIRSVQFEAPQSGTASLSFSVTFAPPAEDATPKPTR